ncbi:MAG TPA: TrbC/VirB2 family protein [Candidatus Megaira endosymbiont of Stentor roeselii]|nr:TrbC/VirB2 family protein [Candidatus Megaera endosymbiont of Stentor roeselii]
MSLSAFQIEINRDLVWRLFMVLFAISIIVVSCDAAFASNNDVVGDTLCRLVSNLSGGIARGIATIAIFAVGVGLFLGKLNWGIAAATAAGVGIIFSAPKLVAFLSGSDANSNCPTST